MLRVSTHQLKPICVNAKETMTLFYGSLYLVKVGWLTGGPIRAGGGVVM